MKPSLMFAALAAVISTASVTAPALAHPGEEHGPSAPAGHGQGVVVAVDMNSGMVTLQHGPIPALRLPAATTEFKVDPTTLLDPIKVGDKVAFALTMTDGGGKITAIEPN
jgi:Cu(I)/Ag(I) efflux system protein CusF